jgi:hypothetical protein
MCACVCVMIEGSFEIKLLTILTNGKAEVRAVRWDQKWHAEVRLFREAHFEVKMLQTPQSRSRC